jgi:hypothetical protein
MFFYATKSQCRYVVVKSRINAAVIALRQTDNKVKGNLTPAQCLAASPNLHNLQGTGPQFKRLTADMRGLE